MNADRPTSHRIRRDLESELRARRPADYRTKRAPGTRRRVERPASRLSPVGALLLVAAAAAVTGGVYFSGDAPVGATTPSPAPASTTPAPSTVPLDLPCCGVEIDGRAAQASEVPASPAAPVPTSAPVTPAAPRTTAPAVDDDVAALTERIAPEPAPAPAAKPAPKPAPAVKPVPNADSPPEDVQMQLPEERIGRQFDTDDGRVCTVTDVTADGDDVVECR